MGSRNGGIGKRSSRTLGTVALDGPGAIGEVIGSGAVPDAPPPEESLLSASGSGRFGGAGRPESRRWGATCVSTRGLPSRVRGLGRIGGGWGLSAGASTLG